MEQHDKIVEALTEFRSWALRNYYMVLAEQLDDTIMVAEYEVGGQTETGESHPSDASSDAKPAARPKNQHLDADAEAGP